MKRKTQADDREEEDVARISQQRASLPLLFDHFQHVVSISSDPGSVITGDIRPAKAAVCFESADGAPPPRTHARTLTNMPLPPPRLMS